MAILEIKVKISELQNIAETVDLTQQKKEAANLESGQNKFKLKHRGKKY